MNTLPPQVLSPKDYAKLHRDVANLFFDLLFKDILDTVDEVSVLFEKETREVRNAAAADTGPLVRALKVGNVQYKDGVFTGQFSRAISAGLRAMGAKFNDRMGHYSINDMLVPADVRAAAFLYQSTAEAAHNLILQKLDEAYKKIDSFVLTYPLGTDVAADAVAAGYRASAKTLEVHPELSKEGQDIFREEYSENLRLSIKDFANEEIISLRRLVTDNARQGYRFTRLAGIIREQYKVTDRKANFLARQETALYMSQFRRRQFSEAGVTRYIWRTSGKPNVRDQHRALNGRIFFYADPPVVDLASGRRRNPGEDYGCNCVDQPILDPVAVGE